MVESRNTSKKVANPFGEVNNDIQVDDGIPIHLNRPSVTEPQE